MVTPVEYGISKGLHIISPIVSRCGSTYLRTILNLYITTNIELVRLLKKRGYKVIATYRDPIDRWVSTYQRFFLEKHLPNKFWKSNINAKYVQDIPDYNKGIVSIDCFYQYTKRELKKHPLEIDQHIRRQVDSYDISLVDRFVNVSDIDKLLLELGIQPTNNKHQSTLLYDKELSQYIINGLKELYNDDYKILEYDKCDNISI